MRHLSKTCVLFFTVALIFSLAGCPGPDTPNPNAGYTISLPSSVSNGTLTASRTTAKAGDSVSLFVTPEWGYEIDYLTVKDSNNYAITVTNHEDALPAYSEFTMPASNVTVSIAFKRVPLNWSYGVDDNNPEDPGEITDFAPNNTGNGCSFNVQFTDDNPYADTYSPSKVGVGNIYVKGGVRYRITWINQTTPENGIIGLNGFWKNRTCEWVDGYTNRTVIGQPGLYYVDFSTSNNDVVDIVFRPNHVSGDYAISNFNVSEGFYYVMFNTGVDNIVVEPKTVEPGNTITAPANPTRDGYVFEGWTRSEYYNGQYFNFETTPINQDITLYARWTRIYTVTFNTNGGSAAPATQHVRAYGYATEPDEPTRSGYAFKGWRKSGSSYNFNFNTSISSDIQLTAQWNPTVTFDPNGGSLASGVQSVLDVTSGSTVLRPSDPTRGGVGGRVGYGLFLGWYNGDTLFDFDTPITEPVTLTAHWEHYGTKAPDVAKEVGDIVFKDGSATPYTAELVLDNAHKKAAIAVIFYKGTGCNNDGDNIPRTLGVGVVRGSGKWVANGNDFNKIINSIACSYSREADGACTFTGDRNGSDNLEQIAAFLNEQHQSDETIANDTGVGENSTKTSAEAAALYPAFYFAKNYKAKSSPYSGSTVAGTAYENGWYLPSIAELYQIYTSGFGTVIQSVGGNFIDNDRYWSSSLLISTSSNERPKAYYLEFSDGTLGARPWSDDERNFIAIREF